MAVEQGCNRPQITSPVGTVNERQPQITWTKVEDAASYRLELESRVPEGKTLVQLDTRVAGTSFRPPRPLTDFRANVFVRITPQCTRGAASAVSVATFKIDTGPLCALPSASLRYDKEHGRVRWKPMDRAVHYQVSVFAGTDGALLSRTETLTTESKLPSLPRTPVVVAVRPRCTTGWGEPVYQLVVSD